MIMILNAPIFSDGCITCVILVDVNILLVIFLVVYSWEVIDSAFHLVHLAFETLSLVPITTVLGVIIFEALAA